ncbi:hypothetical protein [Oricola cellulosilytica]|uniref:Glycine-rich protein n=1 Tax=Oricola cellulosilytica TaxID=1429082 RepID=A0A4R0PAC6_9HYPH|nr:hypothetical protein [Oricola cellulosilytica]TCD14202.1 hypothetical protein E0D97_08960 [Oricola cellulosilytica]
MSFSHLRKTSRLSVAATVLLFSSPFGQKASAQEVPRLILSAAQCQPLTEANYLSCCYAKNRTEILSLDQLEQCPPIRTTLLRALRDLGGREAGDGLGGSTNTGSNGENGGNGDNGGNGGTGDNGDGGNGDNGDNGGNGGNGGNGDNDHNGGAEAEAETDGTSAEAETGGGHNGGAEAEAETGGSSAEAESSAGGVSASANTGGDH